MKPGDKVIHQPSARASLGHGYHLSVIRSAGPTFTLETLSGRFAALLVYPHMLKPYDAEAWNRIAGLEAKIAPLAASIIRLRRKQMAIWKALEP